MKLSIDIDGVISKKLSWSIGDSYLRLKDMLLDVEPDLKVIKKINELYDKGNIIILNTSRLWHDYEVTVEWLKKWGVKYNTLVMAKPLAHAYIDDKNMSMEDFHKL